MATLVAPALALVLSGCGGGTTDAADPADPADPPTAAPADPGDSPSRSATPDASEEPAEPADDPSADPSADPGRDPLADLVEGLDDVEGVAPDVPSGPGLDPRKGPVLGADVSWPQCPKGLGIPQKRTLGAPMPVPEARYVVIGLTNGPGMYPNPCLADQVAWARDRDVLAGAYAVASYPEPADLERYGADGPFDADNAAGRLRNAGYEQARFNVRSMRAAGLDVPLVWIDVEPVPDFEWSGDRAANAAVVEGIARGYTDAGYDIGIYSTPYLWEGVVGDLRLGVPEWRAAGHTSRAEALDRCGADWDVQGGPAVLGQWVQDNRDMNVTCPGVTSLAPYVALLG